MAAICASWRNKEQGLKIALWFSLMVAMVVLTVVAGVTGNGLGLAAGLVAVTCFAFLLMWLFVEALRDKRG